MRFNGCGPESFSAPFSHSAPSVPPSFPPKEAFLLLAVWATEEGRLLQDLEEWQAQEALQLLSELVKLLSICYTEARGCGVCQVRPLLALWGTAMLGEAESSPDDLQECL